MIRKQIPVIVSNPFVATPEVTKTVSKPIINQLDSVHFDLMENSNVMNTTNLARESNDLICFACVCNIVKSGSSAPRVFRRQFCDEQLCTERFSTIDF
jgi:hypothetical protein